jgi:hypothetical protein
MGNTTSCAQKEHTKFGRVSKREDEEVRKTSGRCAKVMASGYVNQVENQINIIYKSSLYLLCYVSPSANYYQML